MRKTLWMFAAVLAALAVGVSRGQEAASAPATQKAATQRWVAVMKSLGSEDFKEREAAQQALAKATWRDLEALRALANETADAEVKERVGKRVQEIDETLAFDPPPISLDLKDADVPAVAEAWSRETGVAWRVLEKREAKFTLKMTDKPLWEVFLALNREHALWMLGDEMVSSQPRVVMGDVEGGLLFYPSVLQRQTNPQEADQPAKVVLSYFVLGDPRMKIVRYRQPVVTSVVDEHGNELYHGVSDAHASKRGVSSVVMMGAGGQAFPLPAGKTVTVQGQMDVEVATEERTVELDDVAKQGAQGFDVEKVHYSFDEIGLRDGMLRIKVAGDRMAAMMADERGATPVKMKLVDADGNVLMQGILSLGMDWGRPMGKVKGPVKGVFTVAVKEEERTIPFHFKDLAVP